MRVITGKYKGKHFEVPRSFKARPTTDFAKENLFNVLRAYLDFEETRALDLFAGTGSISLELLSRGCPEVVCVEPDPPYALKEMPELPDRILSGKLLTSQGLLVLEHGKNYDFSAHPCFLEHRVYGSVNFSFFRPTND